MVLLFFSSSSLPFLLTSSSLSDRASTLCSMTLGKVSFTTPCACMLSVKTQLRIKALTASDALLLCELFGQPSTLPLATTVTASITSTLTASSPVESSSSSSSQIGLPLVDCTCARLFVVPALDSLTPPCFGRLRNSKIPRNPFSASCNLARFRRDIVFSEFPLYCFGVFHFRDLSLSLSSWIAIC